MSPHRGVPKFDLHSAGRSHSQFDSFYSSNEASKVLVDLMKSQVKGVPPFLLAYFRCGQVWRCEMAIHNSPCCSSVNSCLRAIRLHELLLNRSICL